MRRRPKINQNEGGWGAPGALDDPASGLTGFLARVRCQEHDVRSSNGWRVVREACVVIFLLVISLVQIEV